MRDVLHLRVIPRQTHPLRSVGSAACLGGCWPHLELPKASSWVPDSARVSKIRAHIPRTQSDKNPDTRVLTAAMEGEQETRAGPGGHAGHGAFLCSLHALP